MRRRICSPMSREVSVPTVSYLSSVIYSQWLYGTSTLPCCSHYCMFNVVSVIGALVDRAVRVVTLRNWCRPRTISEA